MNGKKVDTLGGAVFSLRPAFSSTKGVKPRKCSQRREGGSSKAETGSHLDLPPDCWLSRPKLTELEDAD
jgi:hypothetical protein